MIVHPARQWNIVFAFAVAINLISFNSLDAVFAFFALCGIYTALKNKNINPLKQFYIVPTKFNLLILAFALSYILGYLTGSPMQNKQWEEIASLRWLLGFYCCYFAGQKLQFNKSSANFAGPIFIAALLAVLIKQRLDVGKFILATHRLQGFYQNANHLAMALVLPFVFLIGYAIATKPKFKESTILFCTLILTAIILFATYTRGSWLGTLVAVLVASLYTKDRKGLYFIFIAATMFSAFYYFNYFNFKDRILYSFDLSAKTSQGLRLDVWKVSWAIFLDHPVFGVGLDESARLYPAYYKELGLNTDLILGNAHSQFFQMLSGTGIVGLILYLGIFLSGYIFFHKIFRLNSDPKRKGVALGSLLVIVALFTCSIADSPFSIREVRNYVLLLLGVSFGLLNKIEYK